MTRVTRQVPVTHIELTEVLVCDGPRCENEWLPREHIGERAPDDWYELLPADQSRPGSQWGMVLFCSALCAARWLLKDCAEFDIAPRADVSNSESEQAVEAQ